MLNKSYLILLISVISVSFAAILIVSTDAPPLTIFNHFSNFTP